MIRNVTPIIITLLLVGQVAPKGNPEGVVVKDAGTIAANNTAGQYEKTPVNQTEEITEE